ncbi:uncharacterized protein LOC131883272 [Tigriopus californicus]|uniref:uncharacterized protein LOC131883272 n=1 Tax=Tigriopus californicus TaxID=6832 RepID=UPI0027DAA8DE|nr:uncharacterized protein LOC131883272 [Tigriopus californicus]
MKVSWVERVPRGLLLLTRFPGRTQCFFWGFIDVLLTTSSFLLALSALNLTAWDRVARIDHYRGSRVTSTVLVTGIVTVLGSLAALLMTCPMIYVAYRRGKARVWLTLYQVKSIMVVLAHMVALVWLLTGSVGGSWSSEEAETLALAYIIVVGLIVPLFEFLVVSHYELEVRDVESKAEVLMAIHDKMVAKRLAQAQRKSRRRP